MAVYCTHCGNVLPPSARFCSNCGVPVAAPQYAGGRPLVRPRAGRQIAGVCLALSQSYGWDVTAVRIIAVLAFLLSSGLIGVAYIAAWIGIPEVPAEAPGTYPPGVYPPGI
jgi:phage shock protein C